MSEFTLTVKLDDDRYCEGCSSLREDWEQEEFTSCHDGGSITEREHIEVKNSHIRFITKFKRPADCPLKSVNKEEQEEIAEALRLKRSTDRLYNYINKGGALDDDGGSCGGFCLTRKERSE